MPISPLSAYASSLLVVASGITGVLVVVGQSFGQLWAVACLGAVAVIAERGSVRLTATTEVSISLVPTLVAAVLFGPLAAIAVAAVSMLPDLLWRTEPYPILRWGTYTATRSITAAAAGLAAVGVLGALESRWAAIAVATAAAALVAEGLDMSFAALTQRVRGKGRMRDVVISLGPITLASVSLYAPVVAIVVIAYKDVSPLTLPLFLIPALAAQRLYVLYSGQRTLAQDLLEANQALEKANLSFATALVATLDARDHYTAGHSGAVAIYAQDIAGRMGLSPKEQELAHLCGLVHDVGKIGLPASLLEKRGPLTLEERRLMETHTAIGERILANVHDYAKIAAIVRHHHERVDGRGYPDGLAGDSIPLIARIIAVADAYHAMTSDRPYREAMPSRVARLRLAQAVETQFDTSVVAAFEAILASASEQYRSGRSRRSRMEEHPTIAIAEASTA